MFDCTEVNGRLCGGRGLSLLPLRKESLPPSGGAWEAGAVRGAVGLASPGCGLLVRPASREHCGGLARGRRGCSAASGLPRGAASSFQVLSLP